MSGMCIDIASCIMVNVWDGAMENNYITTPLKGHGWEKKHKGKPLRDLKLFFILKLRR